jgi:anti-sigma regulatory factor (Ser/Thr protein kinase)
VSAPTSRAPQRGRGDGPAGLAPSEIATVFPSVAPSAASARRFVQAAMQRWGCPDDLIERALLVTSELVTNAYRHARSEARLSIRCDDERLRIEVHDGGSGHVRVRPLDSGRNDGRGLHIVDALADRWGHYPVRHGAVVWAELDRPG